MKEILAKLLNHEMLSREEMKAVLIGITHSEYPTEQITALLTALQMRGVTVDELLGFRDGILETGVPVPLNCDRYIDVVGTGGDRKNTFNISTTSCFVIAGAGYKVAKHGNYAATSTSGASNVIAQHGVKFTDNIDQLNRCLDEAGIVYLHAQLFAKAMKFVGPIRKALQFPTIFNLLGPIVNPSQPQCQLLGVATPAHIVADDPIFCGLPKTFTVGRYHSWVVATDQLPDCLTVTAVSDEGQIMALRHKEYDIHGIQFHPESVLTPDGRQILRNWITA